MDWIVHAKNVFYPGTIEYSAVGIVTLIVVHFMAYVHNDEQESLTVKAHAWFCISYIITGGLSGPYWIPFAMVVMYCLVYKERQWIQKEEDILGRYTMLYNLSVGMHNDSNDECAYIKSNRKSMPV